ncbi:hypothetical protein Q8W71_31280 [Methylobacterium sp. NEAU 140]|uniref:hypothetical protein n=1 Tax=Methylobacterium sp. NEAU 140 TaxID=3064945 RepID=UPI00273600F3|nr:hypothetical protein [Methylobacterium sp. NEAU 140]MDP4027075.1 hypothetical protein [Methylobacterium sp. NEAU 140]
MRLRELETRIVKLERDPSYSALARMSEEELEHEVIRHMNLLAADFPTYDTMIASYAASPEPFEQEVAKDMRTFLDDYLARHRPQSAA